MLYKKNFIYLYKRTINAKDLNAEMAWLNSSEEKKRGTAAKAHATSEFKKRFPYADISRFKVQVDFDPKRKATGEVLFPESAERFMGGPTLSRPQILDTSY